MDGSKLACAWDKWLKENPETTDIHTLDAPRRNQTFLENRLRKAFRDGVEAGSENERKEILQTFSKLLFG